MSIAATARRSTQALPSGFEELYAEHYDFVWRCALRLGATPFDVEDVVQETFVVALRRYGQSHFGVGGPRPSTWLFAILHNVLRNHARGERRRRARLQALELGESLHEPQRSHVESTLGLRLLDEFLRELDPDRRAVFVLAELEGMRGPEIASALGLNHNTVRSRLRAARRAFEARFEHEREPLVDAAANEAAPSETRARGLALLGLSLDPTTSASAGASAGASGGGWLHWLASARGLITIACGTIAALGLGLLVRGAEPAPIVKPTQAQLAAPARADATPGSTSDDPDPRARAELEPSIVIESVAQQKPSLQRPRPAQLDSAAALDRLARARQALKAGDAETSLALVSGDKGWPTNLDARRLALEVGALCTLNQPERARASANAWLAAHPDAHTAVELRAVCWTDDNTSASAGHQRGQEEQ